jgi:uncharacterized damage-inducible protein DinB
MMIDAAYIQRMARYNRWQNESLYGVTDALPEAERTRERGAFFGSIQQTLSHLMWADRIWMSRFSHVEAPRANIAQSVSLYPDWEALKRERASFDGAILDWAATIDEAWLGRDLTWYSGAAKREISRPVWVLVTHMFNHQTHHRGQVHCMLTQAGAKPRDTDLMLLPE